MVTDEWVAMVVNNVGEVVVVA